MVSKRSLLTGHNFFSAFALDTLLLLAIETGKWVHNKAEINDEPSSFCLFMSATVVRRLQNLPSAPTCSRLPNA